MNTGERDRVWTGGHTVGHCVAASSDNHPPTLPHQKKPVTSVGTMRQHDDKEDNWQGKGQRLYGPEDIRRQAGAEGRGRPCERATHAMSSSMSTTIINYSATNECRNVQDKQQRYA